MENSEINIDLRLLLLSSICSILIVNNLLILKNIIPVGYAVNIYSQLPSIFWWSLIITYFLSSVLFLISDSIFRKIGVIYLLINYFIIFLVPYSLGYYSYGIDDELTHLGIINNIISTGRLGTENIYPLTHIFYSTCSLVSNTDSQIVCLLIPSFCSLLFVIGVLAFSRTFLSSEFNMYLFPIILIYYFGHFHFSCVPNYTYFTFIPILLFCITKYIIQKMRSMSAVLTILVLALPFTHPFIWIFIFLIIFSLFFVGKFFDLKIKNTTTLLLLSACSFGFWFINSFLLSILRQNYSAIISGLVESVATEGVDKLSKLDLGWFDFMKFMFLYTGRYAIPLFIISIFILLFFFNRLDVPKVNLKNIHFLIGIFLLFGLFQIILLINPFMSHSPDRITNLNYIIFAMIPLFSISLYYFLKSNFMWKNILRASILLTFVFSLSVYGAFYSPYIFHANIASTYNEFDGMSWLFHHKNEYPIHDIIGSAGIRYSGLINSHLNHKNRIGKDVLWATSGNVQDHFGYDKYAFYHEKDQYIVVTTSSELAYLTLYKNIDRFNANDFRKFNNDPKILKIYDSLNIKIYNS